MKKLTVLYDDQCSLCVRCRHWLATEPAYVDLEFLACRDPEARRRYGSIPWLGAEIVVASDEGDVWVGSAAFLMCLWALRAWRPWAFRLSGPAFIPLAERFFHTISARRKWIAALLPRPDDCTDGTCRVSSHAAHGYR